MASWESCGYTTQSLPPADSEEEAEAEERLGIVGSTELGIRYVLGDVTHPHSTEGDAIIIHCCYAALHGLILLQAAWSQIPLWDFILGFILLTTQVGGDGGFFTALEMRSDEPGKQYELAG